MEIQGYPNYLIYPDGRVFSKITNKFLKHISVTGGYLSVNLIKNLGEGTKTNYISRLIAIHYISNPENKSEVDHINRIRDDNRIENLRWVTKLENSSNKGMSKNNTSGHKNVMFDINTHRWLYRKTINGIHIKKGFNTITKALCFKFIQILLTRT